MTAIRLNGVKTLAVREDINLVLPNPSSPVAPIYQYSNRYEEAAVLSML